MTSIKASQSDKVSPPVKVRAWVAGSMRGKLSLISPRIHRSSTSFGGCEHSGNNCYIAPSRGMNCAQSSGEKAYETFSMNDRTRERHHRQDSHISEGQ